MTIRLTMPRVRLDLTVGCRDCGSRRQVRKGIGKCDACRPQTPLDRALDRRGWKLAELAENARVSEPTLWRIVGGLRVRPETLARVAAAIGISPTDLQPEVPRGRS